MSGANQSITVSEADSRVEQVVRNELVLGFGGEQQNGAYQLNLSVSSGLSGLLPGGLDNEFSAARTTVTATYVLKSASTGETVKSAPALPMHSLIFHRRISRRREPSSKQKIGLPARWQHLSAPILRQLWPDRSATGLNGRHGTT
jgi:hypothetical protein